MATAATTRRRESAWTLLGWRIRQASLLVSVEVPVAPGVVVFAGINGAGKSQVLRASAAVLGGSTAAGLDWHLLFKRNDTPIGAGIGVWDELLDSAVGLIKAAEGDAFLAAMECVDGLLASEDDFVLNETESLPPADREAIAQTRRASLQRQIAQGRLWAAVGGPRGVALQPALPAKPDSRDLRQFRSTTTSDFEDARELVTQMMAAVPGEDVPFPNFALERTLRHGANLDYVSSVPQNPFVADSLPIPVNPISGVGLPLNTRNWPVRVVDVDNRGDLDALTKTMLKRWIPDDESVRSVMDGAEVFQALVPHLRDQGLDESLIQSMLEHLGEGRVPEVPASPHAHSELLGRTATVEWQRLMRDEETELWLELKAPHLWTVEPAAEWRAINESGQLFGLDGLSRAQGRWANYVLAAQMSKEIDTRALVVIVDEPEAGLHRTAETHLAERLRDLPDAPLLTLAASHSPAIVAACDLALVVRRDAGRISVRAFDGDLAIAANDLGLGVLDLLGWYRQFLLVEGEHDEQVVLQLLGPASGGPLGDVLAATRTKVLRIAGVKGSSASLTASVLLPFTDARIIMLIDGVGEDATKAWDEVCAAAAANDLDHAKTLARRYFRGDAYEYRFLREAVLQSPDPKALTRIKVVALGVPDVIDLLPVTSFVTEAESWSSLRSHYESQVAQDPTNRTTFKEWARKQHGAQLNTRGIATALDTMDRLPDDIVRLARALQDAAES